MIISDKPKTKNKGLEKIHSLPPERKREIIELAHQSRKKLNPPPKRKKELTGERLRLIEETSNRIKNVLAQEDVSYKELAKRLDMTPGHVSHLMSGTRNMTLATLAEIADALGYQFTIIPVKKNGHNISSRTNEGKAS